MTWCRELILMHLMSFAVTLSAEAGSHDQVQRSLGGYPLCEASAAVAIDCPQPLKGECLVVGDNEVRDRLFLFQIEDDGASVRLEGRRELPLDGFPVPDDEDSFTISDIEAIARTDHDRILIFGSHSRNKSCKARSKRRVFAQGKVSSTGIAPDSLPAVRSKKHKCNRLFGDNLDSVMQSVCDAVEVSENFASQANDLSDKQERERACNANPAFNIEAAVFVPTNDGIGETWIGLRAPLVNGKAVVLRQKRDADQLTFDAVSFLDLNGFGIRELSAHDGKVWGISGSVIDSEKSHVLWKFDEDLLTHGATILPLNVGVLPTSSEGLAVSQQHLWVLIDGDDPGKADPMTCRKESVYIVHKIAE